MSNVEDELFGLMSSRTGQYIHNQNNKYEIDLKTEGKSKLSLYNQLKYISQITQSAIEIYNRLLSTMIYKQGDYLYIFETKKEAEERYYYEIAHTKHLSYNPSKFYITLDKNNTRIYFKTIEECKRELDGYRFKQIIFM